MSPECWLWKAKNPPLDTSPNVQESARDELKSGEFRSSGNVGRPAVLAKYLEAQTMDTEPRGDEFI